MMTMPTKVHGLPLSSDGPVDLNDQLRKDIKEQKDLLETLGVTVGGVHIREPMSPPRFSITFPKDQPSFKIRGLLEREHFDVGQQMVDGGKKLQFYATRRLVKTDGWS